MKSHIVPRARQGSILLVDHNCHGCLVRRAVLEEQGYTVKTASNGEDGLEAFGAQRFDLVVTEYRLSKLSGRELIQKIRSLNPAVPIVILSGLVEPLGLDERSTGADAVIAKSANELNYLTRVIHRLLNRSVPRKPPGSQHGRTLRARAKTV